MDLDNEPVDWESGDEDLQPASRKASYDHVGQGEHNDADEIEDTVSLGEDEDEQGYFYQHQDPATETKGQNNGSVDKDAFQRPESAQARDDSMGANNLSRSRYHSKEDGRNEGSKGRDRRMPLESPPRQRSSNRHSSPQRSQQGTTRMTHALPPKPSTQVFYIPPSHSSKVEAVGMTSISPPSRSSIRDGKKTNGASTKLDLPDVADHWEQRYSRQGEPSHHARETSESTRNIPVSSLPSTSSLETSQGRRRSASSALIRNSNTSHSQTSHTNHERSYLRLEKDKEDSGKPLPPNVDGFLSHDDRHYVPSSAADVRVTERVEGVHIPQKSRYDRSPAGSPRQRRRARSISPFQDDPRGPKFPPRDKGYDSLRGSGRLRGRDGFTTNDSDIPREAPIVSHDSDRHWAAASRGPPADFSRHERGPRRQNDRPNDEDYANERRSADDRNRPPFKSLDGRGPIRERDIVRTSERTGRRERPIDNQDFIPSPSTLSASYHPSIEFVSAPAMFVHSSSRRSGCMAGTSCFSFLFYMRSSCRCFTRHLSLREPYSSAPSLPTTFLETYFLNSFLSFFPFLFAFLLVFLSYPSFLQLLHLLSFWTHRIQITPTTTRTRNRARISRPSRYDRLSGIRFELQRIWSTRISFRLKWSVKPRAFASKTT